MLRRRAAAHRLLAGLLALWFALLATESATVHACPEHDGTLAMRAAAAAPVATPAADAHAGHDAPAATPASHDGADDGGHDGDHRCSCPDASCGASVLALATPRLSTHFGIAVADVRAILAPATGHRPVPIPYLTPFANGPPAVALA